MKVGSSGSTSGPQRVRKSDGKAPRVEGAGFADLLGGPEGVGEAHAVEGAMSLSGVEAILAAQSVDPEGGRAARQRLARRGEDVLDRLEGVRVGLLSGRVRKQDLAELARMVRSSREAGIDPRLGALLDEIELRAEVELAKLTRDLRAPT